jgi:hypothetical protein
VHLQRAETYLGEIEFDMAKVAGLVGRTKLTDAAAEVVSILRKNKQIYRHLMVRKFCLSYTEEEFDKALKTAIAAGYVTTEPSGPDTLIKLRED